MLFFINSKYGRNIDSYIEQMSQKLHEWYGKVLKMYVANEGQSLEEIATKTNFTDTLAINKFFKRATGISIHEYRNRIDTMLETF